MGLLSKNISESSACDRNLAVAASFQNISLERLHLAIASINHCSAVIERVIALTFSRITVVSFQSLDRRYV